jgi:hypothetical protein
MNATVQVDERGTRPIRIANCSGFFGDRISAAAEMVNGGPIDVLTGDWLAELTMLILWKQKARNSAAGYASTFLTQMEQVLGTCAERGIKVVANAGGLNPAGCAEKVREIADRLGVKVSVAHVEGDDLMDRIEELRPQLTNLDTSAPLEVNPVSANAYLGAWGIERALSDGADVVVTGRVTDASVVVGPAAWWWNWQRTDWDALAGAVAAGHIIECGAQTTGGNYSFFSEIPHRHLPPGFPIAEIAADGSSVITKHPGTGGLVSVGTVTAQLLYEIGAPAYPNPDVVARFDTIALSQIGPDRVEVSGVRGEPAPATTKVSINYEGGYRNKMSFVLTGLDQREKADWVADSLIARLGGPEQLAAAQVSTDIRFVPAPSDSTDGQEAASAKLHITMKAPDERLVGRAFSSAAVELALANYPGFFTTSAPGPAQAFGIYWPALVEATAVDHQVITATGQRIAIAPTPNSVLAEPISAPGFADVAPSVLEPGQPLGTWFGARSGDKGGNANVGIWARTPEDFAWLLAHLTSERIQMLLPEARNCEVRRYEFANLWALNFVIVGYLGEGVASSTAFDPQAKGLGEYLRSRLVWAVS